MQGSSFSRAAFLQVFSLRREARTSQQPSWLRAYRAAIAPIPTPSPSPLEARRGWDFPSQASGQWLRLGTSTAGSIPGRGTKIPRAVWSSQKIGKLKRGTGWKGRPRPRGRARTSSQDLHSDDGRPSLMAGVHGGDRPCSDSLPHDPILQSSIP